MGTLNRERVGANHGQDLLFNSVKSREETLFKKAVTS